MDRGNFSILWRLHQKHISYTQHICYTHKKLKQALNHGLILKKIHRVIKFNQKAWLGPYFKMNTDLRKIAKKDFEKSIFKLMNNAVLGKTMENIRKHRDIKLVTTEKGRNYLVSEPNYHATKFFTETLLAMKMKKTVYLGLSMLDLSKTVIYEFWYDYIRRLKQDLTLQILI